MAVIDVGKFGPVFLDGRRVALPPDAATKLVNARLGGEQLEATGPAAPIASAWPAERPSISRRPYLYRTGSYANTSARLWAFDARADVVRTPIQGDDEDRIVVTDWQRWDDDPLAPAQGAPKTVSRTIAAATAAAAVEPADFNYLGVPAPTIAPALSSVLPSTAIVITELSAPYLLLSRHQSDLPNWASTGAPGDGDTTIELAAGSTGEHIYGGFLPGQRMVVTEIVDADTVRIAAPNADRSIGALNDSQVWRFTAGDAATQIIQTWRLPKTATAKIEGHQLKVNDVLRVTQITENPDWFSGTQMNLTPSSGLERYAAPASGSILFKGKVSCVMEPPGLPVVYDSAGILIASASPSPLVMVIDSAAGGTATVTCNATPYGGTGPFTYLWSWASGGTGLVLSNTTTATASVARTYVADENATYGGVLRCQITDSLSNIAVVDTQVGVSVASAASPGSGGGSGGGSAPPGTLSLTLSAYSTGAATTSNSSGGNLDSAALTATPAGGTGSYTYAWAFVSGGAGLTILNSSTATATVRRAYAQFESAVYPWVLRCTVTDSGGRSIFADVVGDHAISYTGIAVTFTSGDSALYDAAVTDFAAGTLTDSAVMAVSGGTGPYTFTWIPGGPDWEAITFTHPSSGGLTNNGITASRAYTRGQVRDWNFTVQLIVTDTANGRTAIVPFTGTFVADR